MASRISRQDKGKWVEDSQPPKRRNPVMLPASDNTQLIEDNRLTLIGRVTNPVFQKPIWVIDWLITYWNLDSEVVGRELGPETFQFRFKSEAALNSVLRRAPYHYKRWMVILQKWEPVVSNSFPSLISFWIQLDGLPLHFWNEVSLETIGRELGPVQGTDVTTGKVRVQINGLAPLEMSLPIQAPSGESVIIALVYDKLEKHCFYCHCLTHEDGTCPKKIARSKRSEADLGPSQLNTLRSLDEHRQKYSDKRPTEADSSRRLPSYHRHSENRDQRSSGDDFHHINGRSARDRLGPAATEDLRYTRLNGGERNSPSRRSRDSGRSSHYSRGDLHRPRYHPYQRSSYSRDSAKPRDAPREPLQSRTFRDRPLPSLRDSSAKSSNSQSSRTPPPNPPREAMSLPGHGSGEVNSSARERRPALDRISTPSSQDCSRPSALERLSNPVEMNNEDQRGSGISSALKARLHGNENAGGSGDAAVLDKPTSSIQSPDSNQRISATLRIGQLAALERRRKALNDATTAVLPPKAPGKRKTNKVSTMTRGVRSPLQGTRSQKQATIRAGTSVRRKLIPEKNKKSKKLPCVKDGTATGKKNGASSSGKRVDFQDPLNPIA